MWYSLTHGDSDSLTLEKREDMFDPGVNYDNNANNSEDDEEDVDLSDESHPPEGIRNKAHYSH